jgi:hypothetical protein
MTVGTKETPAERVARILAMSEEDLDATYGSPQSRRGADNTAAGSTIGIQAPGSVNGANVVMINGRRVP